MATARWRRRRGHFWTRQLTGRGRRPIGPGGPSGPATRPGSLDLREIDVPAPDGPPTVWNLKPTQAPRTGIVQVEGGNRGRYHTDGTARRLGPARRRSRSIHGARAGASRSSGPIRGEARTGTPRSDLGVPIRERAQLMSMALPTLTDVPSRLVMMTLEFLPLTLLATVTATSISVSL